MDTPTNPPAPTIDPVIVPDVATDPHPGTDPAPSEAGLNPDSLTGFDVDSNAPGALKKLPDMAKPTPQE